MMEFGLRPIGAYAPEGSRKAEGGKKAAWQRIGGTRQRKMKSACDELSRIEVGNQKEE